MSFGFLIGTVRFVLEIIARQVAQTPAAAERSLRELGRSRLYRARILMIVIAGVRLARTAKEIERISEAASAGGKLDLALAALIVGASLLLYMSHAVLPLLK
jgi:hypothetical protein